VAFQLVDLLFALGQFDVLADVGQKFFGGEDIGEHVGLFAEFAFGGGEA